VAVLERQPLAATWRRANALRTAWTSEWTLHLLVSALVASLGLWMLIGSLGMLLSLLIHADPWLDESWRFFNPGSSIAPHIAIWLVAAYLATVRFLAYLDLRTRHEGWELDLLLRRAGQRLEMDA